MNVIAKFPEVYQNPQWEPARTECIRRADGLYEMCKRKDKYKPGKEVDHIKELTEENKNRTLEIRKDDKAYINIEYYIVKER